MPRHSSGKINQRLKKKRADRVRIIAGDWRGRWIDFDDAPGLRPTGARIRETLFNWLQSSIVGVHCLDLYAGSGVLGFEALSRGAASVTLVEKNPAVARNLQTQVDRFDTGRIRVLNQSASDFLATNETTTTGQHGPYGLVFIDPPFADDVQRDILEQLGNGNVLQPGAKIYIEGPSSLDLAADPGAGFKLWRSGRAGNVHYLLLKSSLEFPAAPS